jgi:hypothetical protein
MLLMANDASSTQEQVKSAIAARSVNAVAKALGVGREQVVRFAAGMAVRKGTALVIEQSVSRLSA